jgi:hypothetical protein
MPFQQSVNLQPAPAVAGDFASANPRASMLAGPGALVAGAAGVTVGVFAWASAAGLVGNVQVAGLGYGFVHREQQALITAFLGETSNLVPAGFPITLHKAGDFWGKFAAPAAVGQKVFASITDGTLSAAAAGAVVAGSIETPWFVSSAAAAGELAKISTYG